MDETVKLAKDKMQQALDSLGRELGQIRAGRANASLLDRIQVEYYGMPTPLNQVASIQVPEARVLLITPFDKSAIKNIEQALNASDLGLTPMSDGDHIRLVIPQLTEERRKELAKEVKSVAENSKVALRNARREAMDQVKKKEKAGDLTEDDRHDLEKEIQKLTDNYIKKVDQTVTDKEKELLEV